MRTWRGNVIAVWFATWTLLGPAFLSTAGFHDAAKFIADARGVVVPLSAGLVHLAYHSGDIARAASLALLLGTGFWIFRLFPSEIDPGCYEDCGTSLASMGGMGVMIAALVLTYHHPLQNALVENLRARVSNLRWYLGRVQPELPPAERDDIEAKGEWADAFAAERERDFTELRRSYPP